ncbi:MAG TPA: oxidative damage protection protein [Polyangia bacterium]
MPRMVKCAKLGQELPGVIYRPFDNELGKRIYDNISQDAWRQWIEQSKMMVNEYRIDLTSPQGQRMLLDKAEEFFFGGGTEERPPEYVAPPSGEAAPAGGAPPTTKE